MKNLIYTALICITTNIMGYAQLGGLLNKVKPNKTENKSENKVETKTENKGDNLKYNIEIIKNYAYYYKVLYSSDLKDSEIAKNREEASKQLNLDSAKQMYDYAQKNLKKYGNDAYSVEQFMSNYSEFNKNFENGTLKSINDYLVQSYNSQSYGIEKNQLIWFKYAKSATNSAKKVYTGSSNLDEINKNIDNKKNEYAQTLVKSKWLMCPEQLDYFQQIRFSDNGNETTCVRGKDKFDGDVTDNGVFIYYNGELPLHLCKIYIDGKEAYSLSKDDIGDSNNGNMKPDNGWYKILLLPGLKNSSNRSVARLRNLLKDYGLKKGSEITIKYEGNPNVFKYNLSKFSGTIEEYFNQIKSNQLKSVKLTDTKYNNPAVEKEAIEAYNKFKTINPQYDEGEVRKVSVAGNNWTVYKTKIGLIDYQQTDAYFVIKGKDGNCYEDYRKIRKVYDSKTKTYDPIKVVGGVDKKEISCELIK